MIKSLRNVYIDLDTLNEYIFSNENGRDSAVEITEIQDVNDDGELVTTQKSTREVKEKEDSSSGETIRYGIFQNLFGMLTEGDIDNESRFTDLQHFAANTLYNYGIIKINNEQ